jgi:hypothetical protein
MRCSNPAIALRLQSPRPVGRVAESLAVIARMTNSHTLRPERSKPPRYLRLAEWFCYFVICLGPLLVLHPRSPDESQLPSVLLSLAILILGIVGLGIVLGRKHRLKP